MSILYIIVIVRLVDEWKGFFVFLLLVLIILLLKCCFFVFFVFLVLVDDNWLSDFIRFILNVVFFLKLFCMM